MSWFFENLSINAKAFLREGKKRKEREKEKVLCAEFFYYKSDTEKRKRDIIRNVK